MGPKTNFHMNGRAITKINIVHIIDDWPTSSKLAMPLPPSPDRTTERER
jgi:hypothetical protein